MTILSMAQAAAKRLQITSPTTFIGSTDNNMILLLAMFEEAVSNIGSEFPWPEIQREYTFTLATSTDSYALPDDFDRRTNETEWNRTQKWPLIGPLDAVLWEVYKSGLITTVPRQRFRVKGWGLTQFFIDPTPSSSENGQTCVYEYCSQTTIAPKTWVASTSWLGLRYCSYNGYIFDRGSTGAASTGTSAPTPSSLNDGSITWTLYTAAYNTFAYDSDNVLLDNDVVLERAIWRFKQERGFDFEDYRAKAEEQKEMTKTKKTGAMILGIPRNNIGYPPVLGINNYPQGNF